MTDNNVKTGLTKRDDIPILYTYLIHFEKDIKMKSGSFDITAKSFIEFCKLNDIKCKNSLAKPELDKRSRTANYFLFDSAKTIMSKTDKAHHLFRHIRNSIAHALVTKEKGYYILIDKNSSGNLSMTGKIRIDLFESFIAELRRTASLD